MASASLLAAATLFCACDKDEDEKEKEDNIATSTIPAGEYIINVENGDDYDFDTVKLVIIGHDGNDVYEVCSVPYAKGKFTLDLPETVLNQYLEKIENGFMYFVDLPDGIKISNPSVKIGRTMGLLAHKWEPDISGYHVSVIYHRIGNGEWLPFLNGVGWLLYANGDATVTGSGEGEEMEDCQKTSVNFNFKVNLKKGWNIVCLKVTGKLTREYTTQTSADAVWGFLAPAP
jgi:hypothetical protein